MLVAKSLNLFTEYDTINLASTLAKVIDKITITDLVIYLDGDLGSGKTTFVRYFLKELNYNGHVKSPTYNILEEYNVDKYFVFHFDLYRFNNQEEWLDCGFDESLNKRNQIIFIEWPYLAEDYIPNPDIIIKFFINNSIRKIDILFEEKIINKQLIDQWLNLLEEK